MTLEDQVLPDNYRQTLDTVEKFATRHQRQPSSIQVIAVSKRHPPEKVVELVKLGHRHFAENYMQEAVDKINRVAGFLDNPGTVSELWWHFIGHIQSRKCRDIAASFDWVHTIDSVKVAQKLNLHRSGQQPLNVHIQLNLQMERSKSGTTIDNLPQLAETINALPNLKLRGIMIIPELESNFEKQRAVFRDCRMALEHLNQQGFNLDHLSMGMSEDMEAAIAEGATQVRIGTSIFGPRPNPQ